MSTKATHIPLCRLLSRRGLASRKEAKALVRAGRVLVNSQQIRDPELWVDHGVRIEIDGQETKIRQRRVYMLNKKRGLLTTRSDERGRPTVYEHPLLKARIYDAVGRLDMHSEGLLLFTNDTLLANHLTSPETHVEKTYHVQIDRLLREDELELLREEVDLDGELKLRSSWRTLRHGAKTSWLEVKLREGRNRQLRRMLDEVHAEVRRLIRVRIGDLKLGELAKGEVRELDQEEIKGLLR